jgi:hypothetical protein
VHEHIPGDLKALGAAPDKLFSNGSLAQASSLTSKVACECLRHLADLILRLEQFEIYSAVCQNRSPQDAELHALLKNVAGHARGMMEAALQYAADAEGLSFD